MCCLKKVIIYVKIIILNLRGVLTLSIHESGEMYLETILKLSKTNTTVRSLDIAEEMNFSKPSVSRAVGLLKKAEYIIVDKNGFITLTESGKIIAEKILERHTLLTNFLISLGVDPLTADNDACRIEHHISETSFEAIKKYIKK